MCVKVVMKGLCQSAPKVRVNEKFPWKVTNFPFGPLRVRPLSTSKYLFGGRALKLLSVGQGYGKRITFQAEEGSKNENR